ncbi:chaperonin 10-like protein [Dactylonectria estremocensis]|uniref:Chaperonin 10-like protein n=1 Tax=Dactylonectria estremocensis TaxID=1079267 RepID=A0A9P9EGY7_9HYPO|nr:chaperonin 10-like protein [Dactylonectria estremocensis]
MKALVSTHTLFSRIGKIALGKSYRGRGAEVKELPMPVFSDDEVLVRVLAVALNPTDFKHIDFISPKNAIVGCDYAGEVAAVGAKAAQKWKVGDRIAGVVHGGLYLDFGSFAEYLKVPYDIAWKIPDGMSNAEASTYGVSAITASLALNNRLGLPWANESHKTDQGQPKERPTILIYAGSTSAGLFHIQMAKAAGLTVVTTASPHSFNLVKRYGADSAFDYRSPTVAADIVKLFPNISMAVDCFSEGKSTEICGQVIKQHGGKVVTLLNAGKSKIPGVKYQAIIAYTMLGRPFQWLPPIGPKWPAMPADRETLARLYAMLPEVTHIIKPLPVTPIGEGFEAIFHGLDQLRAGKVSGSKLVVKMSSN